MRESGLAVFCPRGASCTTSGPTTWCLHLINKGIPSSIRLTDRQPYAWCLREPIPGSPSGATPSSQLQHEGKSCLPGHLLKAQEGTAMSFASEEG